ncbi:uncharacterized protein LOC120330070 [Styela clava]
MFILKRGRFTLLLLLIQSFEFIQTKHCKIPEDNEDIDWDKFSGDWNQVLNTNDAVMGKDVGGAKQQNFTETRTGASVMITEPHEKSSCSSISRLNTRRRKKRRCSKIR